MASARFRCVRKTGIETFTVELEPVDDAGCCVKCGIKSETEFCPNDGSPTIKADRSFFKDTPHANIFLSVITPEVGVIFEEGKDVIVDFSPAPAKE